MAQDRNELQYNIFRIQDCINDIENHKCLLDIALEHTEKYTEQNIDRISILLSSYAMIIDSHTEEIQSAIKYIDSQVVRESHAPL
jgi:hypothetical protein